jgi:uncharacterized membrane protein
LHALLWQDGSLTELPREERGSQARSINDAGEIAGGAEHDLSSSTWVWRAVVWRAADQLPQLLDGRYESPCDNGGAAAINPSGIAVGSLTFTSMPLYNHNGCKGYAQGGSMQSSTVRWDTAGAATVLDTGTNAGAPAIADDGAVLVSANGRSYVTGIDDPANAVALGAAGHILYDSLEIRLPDGTRVPVTAADFVDPALGWNFADLVLTPRNAGFDRFGRMYGVATHDGAPAAFIVTPDGAALPG